MARRALAAHRSLMARIGVLTISDRASAGVYDDLGGPAIRETLRAYLRSPWQEIYRCIPDDRAGIEATLITLCDQERCDLVVEDLPGFVEQPADQCRLAIIDAAAGNEAQELGSLLLGEPGFHVRRAVQK